MCSPELLPLWFYAQGEESLPLEADYYPVNGTFSLHYFPYYGKKAQVGASVLSFSSSLCQVKHMKYLCNPMRTGKAISKLVMSNLNIFFLIFLKFSF